MSAVRAVGGGEGPGRQDGEIFADGDDELGLRGDDSFDLGERRIVRGFEDFD